MPESLSILSSKGDTRVTLPPDRSALVLSDWLEEAGFPLNTRCGGRGLCKGCRVELIAAETKKTVRSCQLTLENLPASLDAIGIPEPSLRDRTLHGVSAFELRHVDLPGLRPGLGLALDIGTTTVAGALWDFSQGRCLADASVANEQRRHGDNVLARIQFSIDRPDGLSMLRRALLEGTLEPLLGRLAELSGVDLRQVQEVTVAGNPTMLHILAGESLEGFARFPFRPVFLEERMLSTDRVELPLGGDLQLLPAMGPFVGSDITAGALAAGMHSEEAPCLLVDFGTNGELLLKTQDGFLATATAAGPAFEGGHLACGCPAGPGVVSSLARKDSVWEWKLIGSPNGRPRGLSGAAYIDFIALGLEEGWIFPNGRFDRGHPEVRRLPEADPGTAIRVNLSDDLFISEADVAEILQAKAAIAGGVATLLELGGFNASDLRKVFVAGGFGYHLEVRHACRIGLLPPVSLEKISLIGNSSLGGASLLLHQNHRETMACIVRETKIIELNQTETFEDHFTDALTLEEGGF